MRFLRPHQSTVGTDRLVCRAPRGRDYPGYRALLQDARVRAWLLERFTRRDVARLLRADIEHWNRHRFGPWSLIDRSDGSFVGRGGLAWTMVEGRGVVELPWSVVPGRWGEGLATEAGAAALRTARELGLEQEVVSFTLTGNTASRRVMEKIGLEYAGEIEHAGQPHVLYTAVTGSGRRSR